MPRAKTAVQAARESGAVSMVPPKLLEVPEEKESKHPLIEDAIASTEDRLAMIRLSEAYTEYNRQIKALEEGKSAVSSRLKAYMTNYGLNSVKCNDYIVSRYETSRSTIQKEKLLAHGVSPVTIIECTDISKSVAIKVTRTQ